MKEHSELFIGLDVSKLKTSVASAEDGRDGEIRFFGDIDASPASIAALATKLAKRGGARLHFCYEAGPTGYDLYRQIIALGHDCAVVAPYAYDRLFRRAGQRTRHCLALLGLEIAGRFSSAWQTKKRMQQMHPPSSSPDLVAAPVESVVESDRVVLGAHLVCVKNGLH